MKKVAIVMGSDSDWKVVRAATEQLREWDIPFEAHILSAHRTPEKAAGFARDARGNGFGVIIAAAGMAAHLAGVLAGNTTLPVIGIPMKGGVMDGMDALLATVQMPSGVPVGIECGDTGSPDPFPLGRRLGGQADSGQRGDGTADCGKGCQAPSGVSRIKEGKENKIKHLEVSYHGNEAC